MRDLTACLIAALQLILPARQHRPGPRPERHSEPAPKPAHRPTHIRASSWPRYYGARAHLYDAHGLALVRPYFVAYEQSAEHTRQRERRVAAALAPVGIDYDITLAAA